MEIRVCAVHNAMTRGKLIRAGGAVVVVAALLVLWLAVMSTDDSNSDLATEAVEVTTTTSTSTTTLAPSSTGARQLNSSAESNTTTTISTNGATLGGPFDLTDGELEFPLSNAVEAAAIAADTTTTTSTSTTTAAPAPTGPAPVTISRPSCAAGLGAPQNKTAPFTGRSASIPSGMPAVVVKVSNNSSASRRSLIGLDQADIVFEERIEASATRFFSVFHSSLPANVGPVRSGRTTDIQITQNLNQPVFAYSGSNQGVARQIQFAAENNILIPFVNTDRAPFARDSRYSSPDNLFVDPASLGGCGGHRNPTAVFSYGSASSTTSQPASSVSLQARSSYRFDWNGSKWVRSQSGSAHVTRTGAALAPDNVIVMFARTVQSQIDKNSVDTETIGSGEAWILRDGTITVGRWSRGKGHEPYTLTDGNGGVVRLKAGQTWVVLAPPGTASFN